MSTTDAASGAHLSIGEVLAELRDEFPDITISKIRFLESQGLIDPERTPSGYRKFYDEDLARLRWILHQQKENFLPLKVIKERLDQLQPGEELPDLMSPPTPPGADAGRRSRDGRGRVALRRASPTTSAGRVDADPVASASIGCHTGAEPRDRHGTGRPPSCRRSRSTTAPTTTPAPRANRPTRVVSSPGLAGLEAGQVEQLESFGLIIPALEIGGEARYDADALEVARAAAGFFARGVEGRHLRMYRTFAEREAVLFGQVLLPYVRQRNPEARARLQDELVELSTLGRRLRTALLREAVRESLTE